MEADWSAETGADLARIDCDWPGFVDLRADGERLSNIEEARSCPALGAALLLLNEATSPVFTVKCDAWAPEPEEFDGWEYGYPPDATVVGWASYVDVVLRRDDWFRSFAEHELWARAVTERLRGEGGPPGRVDLVIRAADLQGASGLGITLYAAGCGVDGKSAAAAWETILARAVAVTMREAARLDSPRGE